MIDMTKLHKKTLAALLLAFLMSAMLPACSSNDEEECDESLDNAEGCVQDLPV